MPRISIPRSAIPRQIEEPASNRDAIRAAQAQQNAALIGAIGNLFKPRPISFGSVGRQGGVGGGRRDGVEYDQYAQAAFNARQKRLLSSQGVSDDLDSLEDDELLEIASGAAQAGPFENEADRPDPIATLAANAADAKRQEILSYAGGLSGEQLSGSQEVLEANLESYQEDFQRQFLDRYARANNNVQVNAVGDEIGGLSVEGFAESVNQVVDAYSGLLLNPTEREKAEFSHEVYASVNDVIQDLPISKRAGFVQKNLESLPLSNDQKRAIAEATANDFSNALSPTYFASALPQAQEVLDLGVDGAIAQSSIRIEELGSLVNSEAVSILDPDQQERVSKLYSQALKTYGKQVETMQSVSTIIESGSLATLPPGPTTSLVFAADQKRRAVFETGTIDQVAGLINTDFALYGVAPDTHAQRLAQWLTGPFDDRRDRAIEIIQKTRDSYPGAYIELKDKLGSDLLDIAHGKDSSNPRTQAQDESKKFNQFVVDEFGDIGTSLVGTIRSKYDEFREHNGIATSQSLTLEAMKKYISKPPEGYGSQISALKDEPWGVLKRSSRDMGATPEMVWDTIHEQLHDAGVEFDRNKIVTRYDLQNDDGSHAFTVLSQEKDGTLRRLEDRDGNIASVRLTPDNLVVSRLNRRESLGRQITALRQRLVTEPENKEAIMRAIVDLTRERAEIRPPVSADLTPQTTKDIRSLSRGSDYAFIYSLLFDWSGGNKYEEEPLPEVKERVSIQFPGYYIGGYANPLGAQLLKE